MPFLRIAKAGLMLSVVQAHLASVRSEEEVDAVMSALLTNNKLQRATHNMMAYRIKLSEKDTYLQVGVLPSLSLCFYAQSMPSVPCLLSCHAHPVLRCSSVFSRGYA